MQQVTVKARVVSLLQEKLEAQDACEESNNMNKSESLDELFVFFIQSKQ